MSSKSSDDFNPDRLIATPRTLGEVYAKERVGAFVTECCNMAIGPDCRFCPKCGQEARVEQSSAKDFGRMAQATAESLERKEVNTMATKQDFPKLLNVTIENEGEKEDEYFDLNGTLEEKAIAGEERLVAVYELKELVTVKANVTTEIVQKPYEGD